MPVFKVARSSSNRAINRDILVLFVTQIKQRFSGLGYLRLHSHDAGTF